MLASRESAVLAEAFIADCCAREGIQPHQLTVHADRGRAMTSKDVAALLSDLGVAKSHSWPHVSNDNPFSEAQCKTVTYHPSTPDRCGCLEDARAWAHPLFGWDNYDHHHTGLAVLTPAQVHHGRTGRVLAARRTVLALAYAAHPERFVRGAPQPAAPPDAVWINPPAHRVSDAADDTNLGASLPAAGVVSRGDSAAALAAAPVVGYAADGLSRSPVGLDAP
jgi:putative transposase